MKYFFQTELTYNLVLERGVNDLYNFSEGLEYSAYRLDRIVKDLCKAVEYIHSIGRYHRDIKPENVIVFVDNTLNHTFKLCDFGLAVMDSDMGRGSVGSPGFYSPEMSSSVEYSRKYADYWSLGCLILEGIIGNNRRDDVHRALRGSIHSIGPGRGLVRVLVEEADDRMMIVAFP